MARYPIALAFLLPPTVLCGASMIAPSPEFFKAYPNMGVWMFVAALAFALFLVKVIANMFVSSLKTAMKASDQKTEMLYGNFEKLVERLEGLDRRVVRLEVSAEAKEAGRG